VPVHVPAVPTHQGWRTDPDELAAAVGPRTAAVLLMGPSMPTGAVFDRSHLDALAGPSSSTALDPLRRGHGAHPLRRPPARASGSHPDLAERVITVGSASKELRMIGWRVGWVVAPAGILGDIALVGMTNVVCQVGLARARSPPPSTPRRGRRRRRSDAHLARPVRGRPRAARRLPRRPAHGGWSLLVDTTALGLAPAVASQRLFERGRVAATPMDGWGPSGDRYLRLVFANEPVERLHDLRERFAAAL
jgi:aspartate/methionine/tyrosine aminotransferase